MQLKVIKWGGSLAIRLPESIIRHLAISQNDRVNIILNSQNEIVISPIKKFNKEAFLRDLRELHKYLPVTTSVVDSLRQETRY